MTVWDARLPLNITGIITGLLLAGCSYQSSVPEDAPDAFPEISASRLEAHTRHLADDALMGRKAGSEGFDLAAEYVTEQFAAMGLVPAGLDGDYHQEVPMRGASVITDGWQLVIHHQNADHTLNPVDDFVVAADFLAVQRTIRAPAVFVGYGISAPEEGHDDYAGLDVEGQIVVTLAQAPPDLPSEIGAYYGSPRTKAETAARHGAIGLITLYTERFESVRPFHRLKESIHHERMTWKDRDGRPFVRTEALLVSATLAPDAAHALFTDAALSYAALRDEAKTGVPAGFALPGEITLAQRSEHRELKSRNVAAILEGTDPELRDEFVVLTAHLDGLGVRDDGAIYNGALDNAAGVAVMLETARALTTNPPRRSVLFLALTAEEQGLVGADYFARFPTVPAGSLVANVNLDMPLILYPFADVIAFGAEHSTLGKSVANAAGEIGVRLSPDPMPEQTIFVRSDHFRFVEQGVPAVFLITGFDSEEGAGIGGEIFSDFLKNHYHTPSDDLDLPIDYEAGARFALLNYLIAARIANDSARPQWHPDSFFGNRFGL